MFGLGTSSSRELTAPRANADAVPRQALVVSRGHCLPFGATPRPGGVNFAVFTRHAHRVDLVLFHEGREEPIAEIPLDPAIHRTGDVWHVLVHGLKSPVLYGYRVHGPSGPKSGHRFNPRAVVLDESHYCKNAAAKRTQAVARLAGAVPNDGLVLALTGTPVMNRPPELIAQLRIIGRLADFGSGAKFGQRFKGPDAHVRLHWHLRSRCFVRRLKADVLPQLPAKTRAVVPVELDNEPEYRLAETDVIAVISNCPQVNNPCSGGQPTPIEIVISEG